MERHKRLTNRQFRKFYKEFLQIIEIYKERSTKTEIDWKTYEKEYSERIRYVGRELNAIVECAVEGIIVGKPKRGRPWKLSIRQKVVALLLKSIFCKHNRPMAGLLSLFGAFLGTDVSYKTVERLYSDELVRLVIHNMFVLTIKRKCGRIVDTTGDGTGYTLTVTKHYRTEVDKEGYRKFVYSFNLMDIKTKLYVCYGSGIRSEKEAFENAIKMLNSVKRATGIEINSARLDKYYSYQATLKYFDDKTVMYILPKSNIRINGPSKWRGLFRRMMEDPLSYLMEYYKRENSESGFSTDKRMSG